MKTLTWTGPNVMSVQEAPKPSLLPGWVLLRVQASGICGSEISGYLGHNELRVPPLVMGPYYHIIKKRKHYAIGRS